MAPNTQLWWQGEDNGQRGGPGRPSLSHSLFYFYWTVILYTQLYPGDKCALFTVHRCTVLITSKLQASHRSICHLQICMEGISEGKKASMFLVCDNLAKKGPFSKHATVCWFCSSSVVNTKGTLVIFNLVHFL